MSWAAWARMALPLPFSAPTSTNVGTSTPALHAMADRVTTQPGGTQLRQRDDAMLPRRHVHHGGLEHEVDHRATLVPAFMRLAGHANWWAPEHMPLAVSATKTPP